ncbi:CRISPR-associated endonuclease Cas3-HD [Sulfuracidifex tepidarius]|uniref:CRISPR-associated endonuclease Cas3-HD n=1 Tax=Sulfuracidifex tepidarius TaxID=1294262 RepID=A0A510DYN7_9CREN|nr:CRISPR-associated endonuclease Cas3'' [Sulfuracidifex tepidarius]BBG25070.1 CRISPR-associated endonuclease Cas3-HD [Sulfuracidifex tepidarius]
MTCWAFFGQETFKDHALGTLDCFRRNFAYINPILSHRTGVEISTVKKNIEIAVAFHDVGKASKAYTTSYYGHEFYSGYIVSSMIRGCCNSELRDIAALSSMSHHQAMVERGLELIRSEEYKKLHNFEFNEECLDDINEVAKEIGISVNLDRKLITPEDVASWFMKINNEKFYLYPIILGPLMVCDTYTANAHRGGGNRNLLILEYKKFIS